MLNSLFGRDSVIFKLLYFLESLEIIRRDRKNKFNEPIFNKREYVIRDRHKRCIDKEDGKIIPLPLFLGFCVYAFYHLFYRPIRFLIMIPVKILKYIFIIKKTEKLSIYEIETLYRKRRRHKKFCDKLDSLPRGEEKEKFAQEYHDKVDRRRILRHRFIYRPIKVILFLYLILSIHIINDMNKREAQRKLDAEIKHAKKMENIRKNDIKLGGYWYRRANDNICFDYECKGDKIIKQSVLSGIVGIKTFERVWVFTEISIGEREKALLEIKNDTKQRDNMTKEERMNRMIQEVKRLSWHDLIVNITRKENHEIIEGFRDWNWYERKEDYLFIKNIIDARRETVMDKIRILEKASKDPKTCKMKTVRSRYNLYKEVRRDFSRWEKQTASIEKMFRKRAESEKPALDEGKWVRTVGY